MQQTARAELWTQMQPNVELKESKSKSPPPLVLLCGDDDFTVKQRAKQLFQQWQTELGGFDHETIDANANHAGEALRALAKLREALQTLPFFGNGKAIWFQNCTFLGEERAASVQSVTENLASLAQELKKFDWQQVRLLISAGKVDKRRAFYKTLEKIGRVETFSGWSLDDRNWTLEAEAMARDLVKTAKKRIADEALSQLIALVGPNPRQLANEAEKLIVYVGDRFDIGLADVNNVTSRTKQSRAFALADALGARELPRLLRVLDETLWELKVDSQKSEIGILYLLIGKVRTMILLKEMIREGFIQTDSDYSAFKARLEQIPPEALPADRRFNPLAMHPYALFNSLTHAKRYTSEELVHAMELLLRCNLQLVGSSGLDPELLLQQALVKIVSTPSAARVL